MDIPLQQAIDIFARALRARHGAEAPQYARTHAEQLAKAGDHEGDQVWQKVAELAARLPDPARPETL
jgi:hypothetical protein